MLDRINSPTHDMEKDRRLLLRTIKVLFVSGIIFMGSLGIIFTIYPARNRSTTVEYEKNNNEFTRIDHDSELVSQGWVYAAIDAGISMWIEILMTAKVLWLIACMITVVGAFGIQVPGVLGVRRKVLVTSFIAFVLISGATMTVISYGACNDWGYDRVSMFVG
jgi:hypothetical protein